MDPDGAMDAWGMASAQSAEAPSNLGSNITYPAYGWQGQKSTLLGYYNFDSNAIEVIAMSSEERNRYALDLGKKVHGDV